MNSMIPDTQENSKQADTKISDFCQRFKLKRALRSIGAVKKAGTSSYTLIMFILGLVFTHKNLYRTLETEPTGQDFGKDAVYRLLARSDIRWESLVPTMASGVITAIIAFLALDRHNSIHNSVCHIFLG